MRDAVQRTSGAGFSGAEVLCILRGSISWKKISKKNKYLTNYICQDKIKRGKGQTCRNAGTQS